MRHSKEPALSLLIPRDTGFQRPGRLRWFPHVYWKCDTQRPTQRAPRGVLKFIPTVGCVTCRLDRLPKSWKTARDWDGSDCPAHHPREEADSSREEWGEGAAVAGGVDSRPQKEGETTAPGISSSVGGNWVFLRATPPFTSTQQELTRFLHQHPGVLWQKGRARSVPTLPLPSPERTGTIPGRRDPCRLPRALKPSPSSPSGQRDGCCGHATRVAPGATHQELQHFLGVWVHFDDLLVEGRDLGTEGKRTRFEQGPIPAATRVSPHTQSSPTANKISLPVAGTGSSNRTSQEDPDRSPTLSEHRERLPEPLSWQVFRNPRPNQHHANAAERSQGQVHHGTAHGDHHRCSPLSCNTSPQGRSPATAVPSDHPGCPSPGT